MSSLEKKLSDDQLGQLNSFERKRFALKYDKYNTDIFEEMRTAVESIYDDNVKIEESDTYEARVLASELDPTGIIPLEKGSTGPGSLMKVIARIPELHAAIPVPEAELCANHRSLAIIMHPIFYAEQGASFTLPKPGNIIKVNFAGGSGGKYGRILGILDDSESASFVTEVSAREAMENEETPNGRTLADAQAEEQASGVESSSNAVRAAVNEVKPSDVRTGC